MNQLHNGPWWQTDASRSPSKPQTVKTNPMVHQYLDDWEQMMETDNEVPTSKEHSQDDDYDMTCPKCHSQEWGPDPENGRHLCFQCGWVGEAWIDAGQEWRCYSTDEGGRSGLDGGRVGATIHNDFRKSSLSTCIKGTAGSSSIRRIQKYQSMDQKERRLYQSYRYLQRAQDQANIHNQVNQRTCEKAKTIFKSVSEGKKRPSNRRTSMAACVYLAAQEETDTSRTALDEISNLFLVKKKKIQRVCKTSREVLFQKNPSQTNNKWAPLDTDEAIHSIQERIQQVHSSWTESAKELASLCKEYGFGLYTIPTSLSVGCLWWVYQEVKAPFTMEQLAKSAECSVATVQRSYQALLSNQPFIEELRKVFPDKNADLVSSSFTTSTVPLGIIEDVFIGNAK